MGKLTLLRVDFCVRNISAQNTSTLKQEERCWFILVNIFSFGCERANISEVPLVSTAIPEPWRFDVDVTDDPGFTIVGSLPKQKRQIHEYSICELTTPTTDKPSAMLLNNRRTSNRISKTSPTPDELLDDESQTSDETYKIETKRSKIDNDNIGRVYEKVIIKPQNIQKKVSIEYLYVKKKSKAEPEAAKVLTNIRSSGVRSSSSKSDTDTEQFEKIDDDVPAYYPDDTDILGTSVDKKKPMEASKPSPEPSQKEEETSLPAGYTEFIFEGQIWVQMEKKVFEAELEKARSEAKQYKNLLRRLKGHLNKLDL